MGKLFFYSDQIAESHGNQKLDKRLLESMNTENITIGYIPSTEDKEKSYFKTKAQYYRNYGVHNMKFFDLYSGFDSSNMGDLLKCDIVHLSAGNPVSFRQAIQHRKMDRVLRHYYERGGTIVGVSGGAVQLGRSLNLFQLFTGDCKEELAGLQLVDFEFLPHFNRWTEEFKKEVEQYAQKSGTTVYAGNDGDGLIVEEGEIQLIGDIGVING